MCAPIVFLWFASFLLIQTNGLTSKLTSSRSANDLLSDLEQIVLGNIIVAKEQIEDLFLEAFLHRENIALTAELGIQEANLTYQGKLLEIKVLSAQDRKNITPCLVGSEDELHALPDLYFQQIDICLDSTAVESTQLREDSLYRVDVIMTKIYELQFQLDRCAGDSDCISGVVDNIESQVTLLPLQIEAETVKTSQSFEILKVDVQQCSDNNVAEFAAKSNSLILTIAKCIDTW